METRPGEGAVKEEKFANARKPSLADLLGSFGISEGNITGEEGRGIQPTEYAPNCNCQQRSSPEACLRHQRVGAGQGGASCMLRLRIRPE